MSLRHNKLRHVKTILTQASAIRGARTWTDLVALFIAPAAFYGVKHMGLELAKYRLLGHSVGSRWWSNEGGRVAPSSPAATYVRGCSRRKHLKLQVQKINFLPVKLLTDASCEILAKIRSTPQKSLCVVYLTSKLNDKSANQTRLCYNTNIYSNTNTR